ncbi:MAG: hypothetical protein GF334_04705 [Candidatus Altiarchaeales archaeon]|nr:hypothetical protein [Candidatus Altiarchaeales archaeon]
MPRTRITNTQIQDSSVVEEFEFNQFFDEPVITGTEDISIVNQTFSNYFAGRGIVTAGSGITVVTGTNFVEINSSAIVPDQHEQIDSLVHNLAETSTIDIVRDPLGRVSAVDIRTAPITGTLIRSVSVSRDSFGRVNQVVENQHDENSNVVQTITSTINRSGGQITSVEMVET